MEEIHKDTNNRLIEGGMELEGAIMLNKIRDSMAHVVEAEVVTSTTFSGQHLLLVLNEVVHKITIHKVDTQIKLHQFIHKMVEKLQRKKKTLTDLRKTYRLKIKGLKVNMRR